jgi:hypothetical protein
MLLKLLTLLIRSRWRTFCGYSREEFAEHATATLDDLGYEYTVEPLDTTSGEEIMLGSGGEGDHIVVTDPVSFEFDIVTATVDPLTGFAMKAMMTEDRVKSATSDLSVVTLTGIDGETRPAIARLFGHLVDRLDDPPWQVRHHASFRMAFFLRWKVAVLWKYWLRIHGRTDDRVSPA